jgi:hypothetical protein
MDKAAYNRKRRQFKNLKLIGVSDIAQLMGWTNSKVTVYYQRGKLPEPIGEVGGRPVWLKDQLLPYIEEMGTHE